MRWALVSIGAIGAHAVQLGVEMGVESEMEALEKMRVEGVQDGKRVLVMVGKALEKFENKVQSEQDEDTKQCNCRQTFMEGELMDLCGTTTKDGQTVSACPSDENSHAYGAGSQIAAAETAVETATSDLQTALANEAAAKENAAKYQAFMETGIQMATLDEKAANKRLEEIFAVLKDKQTLQKALSRAIQVLADEETGGTSSVPKRLTPGMTLSLVQLQQEVTKEVEKGNKKTDSYAEQVEKQLLAFEVAAGQAPTLAEEKGSKAPTQDSAKTSLLQEQNPARLYLMNDRADMVIGYLRAMYTETTKAINALQANLEDWQDAVAKADSPRDKANAATLARMGTTTGVDAMVNFRKEEITYGNEAAQRRQDLAAKQGQLDMMRTYMRETQMNQVIETEACRARSEERAMEKAAIKKAKDYLQEWATSEISLVQETPASFVQTETETEAETEEGVSAGAAAAFDTLKQLRQDFETYRAQMQGALNTLNSDWKDCKRDIQIADEELQKSTIELAQVQAAHNQMELIQQQTADAIVQLQKQIDGAEAKAEAAADKRDKQRSANREEAEACESSVAVTHKVIEVLREHFQYGSAESAIDGIQGAQYSEKTRAARRDDDTAAANGIQHNERTAEMSAIISSLQKVAFEFEKCGQTVRATDRKEENAFRRGQQAVMKTIQDLAMQKAYEQGQNSVAFSRLSQLGGDLTTAKTMYTNARLVTRQANYKNCQDAVADYDAERAKLMQKIENAIAVKDLIMVAMQNIKGVPAYPQNCAFEQENGQAKVETQCDPQTCVVTTALTIEVAKTMDGNDDQCKPQSISGNADCSGDDQEAICDTQMLGMCQCKHTLADTDPTSCCTAHDTNSN